MTGGPGLEAAGGAGGVAAGSEGAVPCGEEVGTASLGGDWATAGRAAIADPDADGGGGGDRDGGAPPAATPARRPRTAWRPTAAAPARATKPRARITPQAGVPLGSVAARSTVRVGAAPPLPGRWTELRVTPPVCVRDPTAAPEAPVGPEATLVVLLKAGDEATRGCEAAMTRVLGLPAEPHPARPAARSELSATRSR
jgi:hypothetical protein